MAPVLLEEKPLHRRTLAHDMESFFAVIVWMASFNHFDEAAFRTKPLAIAMLDRRKTSMDIVTYKGSWFKRPEAFHESIVQYFEQPYLDDVGFLECLFDLREILYPDQKYDFKAHLYRGLDKNDSKVTEDADPMKEGLFRKCMKKIDDFLNETKGCSEMEWIDSNAQAQHVQGEDRVD
jgi:hypothetical protein